MSKLTIACCLPRIPFRSLVLLGTALCLFCSAPFLVQAAPAHSKEESVRKAIVLATFGSTVPHEHSPVEAVSRELRARYPDIPVFVGYTAAHVARTLKQQGTDAPMLPEVLASLAAQGYTHVAVQSLHVIPGREFDDVREICRRFSGMPKGLRGISVGLPLIGGEDDADLLAEALLQKAAKHGDKGATVFVGHGTHGPGSLAYAALQASLWRHDPSAFVGSIEGRHDAEAVMETLRSMQAKSVGIHLLLTVAGDHALNDVLGEEDSWLSLCKEKKMRCSGSPAGLASLPEVVRLWVMHAEAALAELPQ